ncbi:CLUMA_CG001976, isoform A [Clunio marinus]|uniref:Gustatory receptor n=1 Tax=Clunio marinus TaxID=568069 RepID=A0A1J1HJV0_9DIPT|nr:CLUMA_CG001976, isoform A [Clunio marinus]
MESQKKPVRPSMEEDLNNCVQIFEIVGLQFFSLKSIADKNFMDRPSTGRKVFVIVLIVVITFMTILFLSKNDRINTKNVTAKNVVMFSIRNFMNVGLIFVVCSSIIQSYLTTHKAKIYFKNVKEISKILENEFGVVSNFKDIRNQTWKRFLLSFLFYNIVHITNGIFTKDLQDFLNKSLGIIPLLYLWMFTFKFVFHVKLINHQLKTLQKMLQNIFKYQPLKIIDAVNIPQISIIKPMKPSLDLLRHLQGLRKIYNIIYANSILVNECFGITILVLLCNIIIALTVCGYETFIFMLGELENSKTIETVSIMIMCISLLIALVFCCQRTHQILKRIGATLNEMECDYYDLLTSETREFLQKFYLQLSHQPVIFTAFGFCNINLAMLGAIVIEIASYQIILVQFYAS